MANKLIFVSCGQLTEAEKSVGVLLKAVVDGTSGFEAYFAGAVHDLDALAHHVLEGIQRCAGAIVVLHDRGVVMHSDGAKWGHRSSVWVNQEVAILLPSILRIKEDPHPCLHRPGSKARRRDDISHRQSAACAAIRPACKLRERVAR